MKHILATLVLALFISLNFTSAQVQIIHHDEPTFHDFPGDTYFEQEPDGSIWLVQTGGFTGDVIHRYKDGVWEEILFSKCSNCVYRIAIDNNGVVHLSTNIALFSWDGNEWIQKSEDVFNLGNIEFDGNNNLWFTQNLGIEVVLYMTPLGTINEVAGITGDISRLTIAPNNSVWLKNDQDVVEITSGEMINRYDVNVMHLAVDKNNVLWFVDFEGNVGKIENGIISENILYEVDNGFPMISFTIDRANDLFWFGQQGINPGIMFWNGSEATLLPADDLFPGLVSIIESLFVNSDGTLWAASRFNMPVAEVRPMLSSTSDLYEEVNIFPNPVIDMIKLELGDNVISQGFKLQIFNSAGTLLKEIVLQKSEHFIQIDIKDLNAGLHYILIPELGLRSSFVKK